MKTIKVTGLQLKEAVVKAKRQASKLNEASGGLYSGDIIVTVKAIQKAVDERKANLVRTLIGKLTDQVGEWKVGLKTWEQNLTKANEAKVK